MNGYTSIAVLILPNTLVTVTCLVLFQYHALKFKQFNFYPVISA